MDTVFASDLNLPPGQWPTHLKYKEQTYERIAMESLDGDLLSVTYIGSLNSPRIVKVLND